MLDTTEVDNAPTIRSRFKWSKPIEITLRQFLQTYIFVNTNNNPPWQRDDLVANPNGTSKNPSKYQGIIQSIFIAMDIGLIRLISIKGQGSRYDYETLDGAHRIRAIEKFRKGEFRIHKNCPIVELREKYYADLTDDWKQMFDEYPIQLVIYYGMSSKQKGEQFRIANAGDPVSPMGKLNTYHPNVVGDIVRAVVHQAKLFEILQKSTNNGIKNDKSTYLKFANKNMCYHEIVARILCMVWHGDRQTPKKAYCGAIGSCDHGDNGMLVKMYEDADIGKITESDVMRMYKKMMLCLDFLAEIADARRQLKKNEGLTSYEVTLLSRWYMHYTNYHGPFKLNDSVKFYESFYKSLLNFIGSDNDKLIKGYHDGRLISDKKGAFVGMLSEWKVKDDMVRPVLWLINEGKFDPEAEGSITVLDRKRCFSRTQIEERLAHQGYTCAISGEKLSAEDARGAHIEPWSEGGKTDQDNFMVVHHAHNAKMSTMNALEYKKMWLSKNPSKEKLSID